MRDLHYPLDRRRSIRGATCETPLTIDSTYNGVRQSLYNPLTDVYEQVNWGHNFSIFNTWLQLKRHY